MARRVPKRKLEDMPELMQTIDVCDYINMSRRTLRRLVQKGEFPQPIRYNDRLHRWPKAIVQKWYDSLGPDEDDLPFKNVDVNGFTSPSPFQIR